MGDEKMVDRYRVIISPQAFEDLNQILDYIALDSPANSAKVIDHLLEEIASLDLFPGRHSVDPGSRGLPFQVHSMSVPPFRVVYQIVRKSRTVRVLTVEHGARQRKP
jgi:plasmid stabilization system protein ParE